MAEQLTSVLDAIGLLLLAAGIGCLIGGATEPGWGWVAAGVVVLAGSAAAAVVRQRGGDRG